MEKMTLDPELSTLNESADRAIRAGKPRLEAIGKNGPRSALGGLDQTGAPV